MYVSPPSLVICAHLPGAHKACQSVRELVQCALVCLLLHIK